MLSTQQLKVRGLLRASNALHLAGNCHAPANLAVMRAINSKLARAIKGLTAAQLNAAMPTK